MPLVRHFLLLVRHFPFPRSKRLLLHLRPQGQRVVARWLRERLEKKLLGSGNWKVTNEKKKKKKKKKKVANTRITKAG